MLRHVLRPINFMEKTMSTAFTQKSKTPWWVILLNGIAMAVLGLLMLSKPDMTLGRSILYMGVYWLVSGGFQLVGFFFSSKKQAWKLVAGLLGILASVIVFMLPTLAPMTTAAFVITVLGILSLTMGGICLYQVFKGAGLGLGILGGLDIVIGLLLFGRVLSAAVSLPLIVGILALAGCAASIFVAFRNR